MKDFPPGKPCPTPQSAVDMYQRDAHTLAWSKGMHDNVLDRFRSLKAVWRFDTAPDDVWNDAVEFTIPASSFGRSKRPARQAFRGNCNAFAPKLKSGLAEFGIHPDCLRLVVCEIVTKATGHRQGHMVLAILTDQGTLICCNLRGCWMLLSPEWDNETIRYDWHSMEGPGNTGWVNISSQTLEEVLEMIG